MDFDPINIKKVKINTVRPNSYNPKLKGTDEYEQVVASIRRNGLKTPIFVRETDDGLVIVDGEQRWTAANELGYEEIYIYNLGHISEDEAKALTIWFEVQVPFSDVDLAPIVVELDENGITLPYTEEQIIDFRHLADFTYKEPQQRIISQDNDGFCKFIVRLAKDQFEVVSQAIEKVSKDKNISEGSALSFLVCGDTFDE